MILEKREIRKMGHNDLILQHINGRMNDKTDDLVSLKASLTRGRHNCFTCIPHVQQ